LRCITIRAMQDVESGLLCSLFFAIEPLPHLLLCVI
jgi:hypothetical protein